MILITSFSCNFDIWETLESIRRLDYLTETFSLSISGTSITTSQHDCSSKFNHIGCGNARIITDRLGGILFSSFDRKKRTKFSRISDTKVRSERIGSVHPKFVVTCALIPISCRRETAWNNPRVSLMKSVCAQCDKVPN